MAHGRIFSIIIEAALALFVVLTLANQLALRFPNLC